MPDFPFKNRLQHGCIIGDQPVDKHIGGHTNMVESNINGGMISKYTVADPNNPNMMDFVGFDSSTPAAIQAFVLT